ncbi:spore germination protein [Fictibacillus nanhaiensis]|uniref:GerAB/ArcD/ProY family transporter n=1 Tax=Fictibacillus nanhaiensis TaxID=742169 RepID=UPI00203FDAED|nr:GerAB/ArcD/ProY family transporter [Fictibacillus nanhaiensis]MCM3730371.1 spore germination protein [Fictibacillus nanhaiensis]
MLPLPKEHRQVSPYFTFYLIHSMQKGVSILGFERYIMKDAGYDSWISIIISGLSINLLLWISYSILNKGKNDIVAIHANLFGKWIGGVLSLYFIVYFLLMVTTSLRTYIEVIQIWMFSNVHTWYLAIIFLLLAYSFTVGGFRVITGICFFSVIIGIILVFLVWFPLKEAEDFTNILPILGHATFKDLLVASKTMSLGYLGFEVLFMYYPFIKQPERSQKWAHFGVLYSIFLYLLTAVVAFSYYSEEQLARTIWSTLTLWKIVDLPFVERFEYAGISIWLFIVISDICLGLWAASRGLKQLFSIKQKQWLVIIILITFIATIQFTDRKEVDLLNMFTNEIGFYTIYVYIPILYILQTIIYKVRKKRYGN